MLVISHSPFAGTLPLPSGPSPRAEDKECGNTSSLIDEASVDEQLLTPPLVARKRVMARSTSMFQHPSRMATSTRSTTPLSSVSSSSRGSRSACLQSTPASTVHSGSLRGNESGGSSRKVKLEPVIEIDTPRHQRSRSTVDKTAALDDPAAISYDVPVDIQVPPFARKSSNSSRDLARVWEAVAGARRITVICGAGISVSSPANIPDFRSTAGLFRKLKEKHPNAGLTSGKDLFDASLFNSPSTSSLFYSMIAELKAMADAASPTTFHHLLKRLDMEGRLQRVYTQNIDGLEERAGLTFGLGESGDSRATLRALGKRKRDLQKGGLGRSGSFARSKSDSAVLFTQKEEARRGIDQDTLDKMPMFPRTIPLHGSLSTLTCSVCNYKIYLSLASSGPPGAATTSAREYSPDAPDQALAAMDLLSQGEAVACVKCQDYERVRSVAGLRSRGIGVMKVDVVLYNGQNDGAEQVGECVQRDILGLRDPNETGVPESTAEKMARERREKKEKEKEEKKVAEAASLSVLNPIAEATSSDDAFAAAFRDEQSGAEVTSVDAMAWKPSTPQKKPTRAPRLKPLPPDLLIVAGTSLKVPGTKRIVREFAKACHARDHRVYPDSDESEGEEESSGRKTRGKKSRSASVDGEAEEDEEEEEEDINAPIRTILFNYDFPMPPSSWEGVFDVWVQGDVQQSALGLWEASKYATEDCVNDFSMREDEHHELPMPDLSWSNLLQGLLDERKAAKKGLKKGSSQQTSQSQQSKAASQPSQSKAAPSTPVKAAKKAKGAAAKEGDDSAPAPAPSKTAKAKAKTVKKEPIVSKPSSQTPKAKKAGAKVAPKKEPKEPKGIDSFMPPTKASTVSSQKTSTKKGAKATQ